MVRPGAATGDGGVERFLYPGDAISSVSRRLLLSNSPVEGSQRSDDAQVVG